MNLLEISSYQLSLKICTLSSMSIFFLESNMYPIGFTFSNGWFFFLVIWVEGLGEGGDRTPIFYKYHLSSFHVSYQEGIKWMNWGSLLVDLTWANPSQTWPQVISENIGHSPLSHKLWAQSKSSMSLLCVMKKPISLDQKKKPMSLWLMTSYKTNRGGFCAMPISLFNDTCGVICELWTSLR